MAKPIKIWNGSEWVDVAVSVPNLNDLATTSALSAHESDTTNVHGISNTANLALTTGTLAQFSSTTSSQLASTISDETGSGSLVFNTTPTISAPIVISPEERCNIVASAATGTINFDVLTSTIWYYTSNASANHTINVRGNSSTTLNSILAVGDSISIVWLNTNGPTAYWPNTFQIDGSSVTPKWATGTAPTGGNASSIDGYTYSIIKTAATPTYLVLAGQTKFA